jgi:hypothetical protein
MITRTNRPDRSTAGEKRQLATAAMAAASRPGTERTTWVRSRSTRPSSPTITRTTTVPSTRSRRASRG